MPTIYYIGDSTVSFNEASTYPQQGMSNAPGQYLRAGVTLSPHGRNGRSNKSFLDEGAFDPMYAGMEPGGAVKIAGFLAAELQRIGGIYEELLAR